MENALKNENEKFYIGLDIGGTKILGALFNDKGDILKRDKKKTKADEGAEAIMKQIAKVIDALIEEIDLDQVVALGAGVPGIIDGKNGIVIFSPNMNWENFRLKEEIEKKYGLKTFIGNDVNVGTLGEWKYGAGKDFKNIVGIFVGTGVGGGLIINGAMHEGVIGAAGEIGHMVLNPDGPYCGCGSKGCLESYASKTAMQNEIMAQLRRGRKTLLAEKIESEKIIRSESLKEAYERQDELTIEIIDRSAYYLGLGAANIINLLNPELIIFGGGVIESMGDIYLPKIEETALKYSMPKMFESCRIKPAKLGDDAGVYGAMGLILENMK